MLRRRYISRFKKNQPTYNKKKNKTIFKAKLIKLVIESTIENPE